MLLRSAGRILVQSCLAAERPKEVAQSKRLSGYGPAMNDSNDPKPWLPSFRERGSGRIEVVLAILALCIVAAFIVAAG